MVMRRLPHSLPGTDPLLLQKILLIPFLCAVVATLALSAVTATVTGAQGGHLPWPIAQWALTTPFGVLVLALIGGLAWGLPFLLVLRVIPAIARPMDVTELPLFAWPRPLALWRTVSGGTLADFWLGRGWPQRAITLLMLAFAALLLIGMFAAFAAAGWYELTHLTACAAPSCPPIFVEQLVGPPELVGLVALYLGQFARMAYLQRRCGIWFRMRDVVGSGWGSYYIRRPGVTPEAAAAALQRRFRGARRPMARLALVVVLALMPAFLLLIGGVLLSTWLSTQWIPA